MNPFEDPRVQVDQYTVKPTCYDDLPEHERSNFCLTVMNGHAWGWSIRRGPGTSSYAMNRKGLWVLESRGHGGNRFRRYELEEALALALKHVDALKINRSTAQEWVNHWASKEES